MTDKAPERLARSLRTVPPYKHALEIMADDLTQWLRDENVHDGDVFEHSIILGQGDYPTGRQIIENAVRKMNEAATALEAAQARIAALQDTLNIERALSDGAHKRARTARAEALEEAATKAERLAAIYDEVCPNEDATSDLLWGLCRDIRALKEKPNG